MARFRTSTVATAASRSRPDTVNLAGGEAFTESAELELILLLTTTLLKIDFYRSANATADRLKTLVKEIGPEYAAKAAIFARQEFGIRSATHLVAGELSHQIKSQAWASNFYTRVCHRPDDALEILAYVWGNFNKHIPSRVKRGLGAYLRGLNEYTLGKYRSDISSFKMVDVVNLIRPKHSDPIGKLVRDRLPVPVTWEIELTRAGKSGGEVSEAAVWAKLLKERKLGYMALLRNIRNIIQADRNLVDLLHAALTNREAIKKALVFPYRFEVALKTVKNDLGAFNAESRSILEALDEAVEYSLDNVPVFPEGKTLVAIDESGSMQVNKIETLAGLFGISLARANNGDLISFDTTYRTHAYRRGVTVLATLEGIRWRGGGTDFHQIFHYALGSGVAYDRIIILSDMQSWVYDAPTELYRRYCATVGKPVRIFTFDLTNYGSLQFPEKDVYALAGFNADAVFKIMRLLEEDPRAIVNRVKAVDLLAKTPRHTSPSGEIASEEESASIPA
jgi:60 kDa SS-A/Ro ribonucleoprotein